jgi:hypothetical protein
MTESFEHPDVERHVRGRRVEPRAFGAEAQAGHTFRRVGKYPTAFIVSGRDESER